jgi:hypothetical protein
VTKGIEVKLAKEAANQREHVNDDIAENPHKSFALAHK